MKRLIILSGIPGSGKSTWAKKFRDANKNVYIVSSDEIRYEITGVRNDFSKQGEVWKTFDNRIQEFFRRNDCIVVLDALNDLNSLREKYVIENPGFDSYELVIFNRSEEFARKHNLMREKSRHVPDEAMRRLIDKFEQPNDRIIQLFDKIDFVEDYFTV